ncbi:unnamed protein product, partial [Rotaria socialis]
LLSCLGRQGGGDGEPADTPNIDKLRGFLDRFKQDPNSESSFSNHSRLHNLNFRFLTLDFSQHTLDSYDTSCEHQFYLG